MVKVPLVMCQEDTPPPAKKKKEKKEFFHLNPRSGVLFLAGTQTLLRIYCFSILVNYLLLSMRVY